MLVSIHDGWTPPAWWRAIPAPLAVRAGLIVFAVAVFYGTIWLVGVLV